MKRLIVLLLLLMTSFSSHSKERNKGSISLSMGPLSGRLEYKDNTFISGLIDQKVSGTRFGVKIIKTRKNNLLTGFGSSYSELTGVKTLLASGYNSTYGNVYLYGTVKSIRIISHDGLARTQWHRLLKKFGCSERRRLNEKGASNG